MKKLLLICTQFLFIYIGNAQEEVIAKYKERMSSIDSLTTEIEKFTTTSKFLKSKIVRTGNRINPSFQVDKYIIGPSNTLLKIHSRQVSIEDTTRRIFYFHNDSLVKVVQHIKPIKGSFEKTTNFYFRDNLPECSLSEHFGHTFLAVEEKGSPTEFFIKEAAIFLKRYKTL
jgi:hypothetical protein